MKLDDRPLLPRRRPPPALHLSACGAISGHFGSENREADPGSFDDTALEGFPLTLIGRAIPLVNSATDSSPAETRSWLGRCSARPEV